jgi:hypothetical protein
MSRTFFNFGLIGCKSTKKCAKSTTLKVKVCIRKCKCHQKIPWAWFAENHIGNQGLISNRNGARDKKAILIKNFIFSRIRCVQNQTLVANIYYSKSCLRNLLMAFKFSNSDFYFQNCGFRALFGRFTANQAEIQKSTTHSMFTTSLAFYQNVEKHPFSTHSICLLTPETKIERNRTHLLKSRQFSQFSPYLKPFRYKL